MNCVNLKGKKNKFLKKINNRELRNSGYIPCIVYGINKNIKFYILLSILKKVIYTFKVYKVIIEIKNEYKIEALLKEIQFNPINDDVIHVDFYELKKNQYIIISVPIISVGHSLGVSKGGEYKILIKKINLKVIPEFIIDHMDIDTSNLDIGDNLSIKDIYNPKYIILHNWNDVIASVKIKVKVKVKGKGKGKGKVKS
ncbi:LSU ribosomal protein L25p [Candidatus Karelsulcia muelleri]|uniref:Large ribosomal subunit protein bL25 n=1 Tax=Candidatus Karelsulcia muelleri TaxID=336810 RepID=A0A654M721_9FLAO|nr:50S ribosomal protein L25 [Candidatus Karelsulcia muelleri]ALP70242.1 LSU ribosomal protein L25p [Candidatus Karelsulcia muelleri]QND78299.1 LSU ribosomal protein L25p [Candidatus Karelsulcia muelleri]